MRVVGWTLASFALWASLPTRALAYEDQASIGVAVGYAGMSSDTTLPRNGLDVALSAGGGVGDAWSIQGLLGYNHYFDARPLHLTMAGLEAVYALDIVRFVPLIGFGLDGLLSVRKRQPRGDFAAHVLLGADFLVDRRWIVGLDVRGFWVATNTQSPLPPLLITAALRIGVRIDVD